MRKVIDGKMYNTATANEIGSSGNGLGCSDFDYVVETLFVTTKGNWFLHGEGGARTKYGEGNGREIWGSENIIPMTKQEAFRWASMNLNPLRFELYFKDMIEEA